MVNVVNLICSISAPTGLWATILNWIEGSVINYGWVIILFTLLVKVCLSPLDLLMKFNTKKSSLVQQKLAPQIARINQKYQNDRNQAQLQTNALYKKEGYNVFVSCILMIVNLAITMTVFFTLFASLREMSAYRAIKQYDAMQTAYVQTLSENTQSVFISELNDTTKYPNIYVVTYQTDTDGSILTDPDGNKLVLSVTPETNNGYSSFQIIFEGDPTTPDVVGIFENYFAIKGSLSEDQKAFLSTHYVVYDTTNHVYTSFLDLLATCQSSSLTAASNAANKAWSNVKEKWLWVENIWVADNYKSPVPSYEDLKSMADASKIKSYQTYVKNIDKTLYNNVTSSVSKKVERWNGFFILAVLAGVTSFLSQYISDLSNKSKNKHVNKMVDNSNPNNGTMKIMKFMLPAMMVIFVVTSSAAFSIYIVSSSIISIAISALTGLIVNACYKKKEAEVMEYLEKEVSKQVRKSQRQNRS